MRKSAVQRTEASRSAQRRTERQKRLALVADLTSAGPMRVLISISAFCLIMVGCATKPHDFRAVWTGRTAPPADLAAPAGFMVSPAQAYAAVWDARVLSLKHDWNLYADSRYYYVHDAFFGESARRAFIQGVRIDGQTGKIVRR